MYKTFEEFLKINKDYEIPITNDMCFKYVFSDKNLIKKLLVGLNYGIKMTDDVIIETEVGVGTVGVKIGEKRFDLKVRNVTSDPNENYAMEMNNYHADMEFKGFFKLILKLSNDFEENKKYVTNISEVEKNHVIIFDNDTTPKDKRLYTEIFFGKRKNGMPKNTFENKYYDGEEKIFYLNNIVKFDKIESSEDKSLEILKSLKYNSEELLESGDDFMKELGEKVKDFNSDELKREAAFEAWWEEINKRAIERELSEANEKIAEANEKIAKANEETAKAKKETAEAKEETAKAKIESAKAKEKNIASALKFKKLGLSIQEIIELTGLDEDTINKL